MGGSFRLPLPADSSRRPEYNFSHAVDSFMQVRNEGTQETTSEEMGITPQCIPNSVEAGG